MKNTPNKVFDRLCNCVRISMVDSANEIAQGIRETAKSYASLDPNEVAYSMYKGYDNMGEFNTYINNFKVKEAKEEKNTVKSRAYNDYKVFFKKISGDVPYGNFIEWGTGTSGYGAPLNYDYTTEPWDERTKKQSVDLGTFGMIPNPHWTIAYRQYKEKKENIFIENLRKNI